MPSHVSFPEPPACIRCGVCCFSDLPEYARVFGADYDRMDEYARSLTVFTENRCFMRMEEGHCAALVIDPDAGTFLCSIYEMRPDACRSLERAGGACHGEILTKSARPLLALQALLQKKSSQ